MEKNRSLKQSAGVVARAVNDVNRVLDAVPVMAGHSFFNATDFKKGGLNALIRKASKKHKISEYHIRTVGGWKEDKPQTDTE